MKKKLKKPSKKNIKKKVLDKFTLFFITLLIILFCFGIFSIKSAQNLSEYSEFESYRINFYYFGENNSSVNVSNAQFTYDFGEKMARVTLKPDKKLKRIRIYLSKKDFELLKVEKILNNKREPINITEVGDKEDLEIIFNEEITKEDWILVSFKIDLSSNAKFRIITNSVWKPGVIYLTLGDALKCVRDDCAFSLSNLEFLERYEDSTKTVRLGFINQTGEIGNPTFEFEITAYSKTLVNNRDFRISFGASLIVGAIFAFFTLLIERGKSRKN